MARRTATAEISHKSVPGPDPTPPFDESGEIRLAVKRFSRRLKKGLDDLAYAKGMPLQTFLQHVVKRGLATYGERIE